MHVEVAEALALAAEDESIRAVVITGAGRGFCAGQDLNDRNIAPGERIDLGGFGREVLQPADQAYHVDGKACDLRGERRRSGVREQTSRSPVISCLQHARLSSWSPLPCSA